MDTSKEPADAAGPQGKGAKGQHPPLDFPFLRLVLHRSAHGGQERDDKGRDHQPGHAQAGLAWLSPRRQAGQRGPDDCQRIPLSSGVGSIVPGQGSHHQTHDRRDGVQLGAYRLHLEADPLGREALPAHPTLPSPLVTLPCRSCNASRASHPATLGDCPAARRNWHLLGGANHFGRDQSLSQKDHQGCIGPEVGACGGDGDANLYLHKVRDHAREEGHQQQRILAPQPQFA
ncbi:hypothetical protein ES703_92039 [subsurface metagenome]